MRMGSQENTRRRNSGNEKFARNIHFEFCRRTLQFIAITIICPNSIVYMYSGSRLMCSQIMLLFNECRIDHVPSQSQ
jgi:hypothetical protein